MAEQRNEITTLDENINELNAEKNALQVRCLIVTSVYPEFSFDEKNNVKKQIYALNLIIFKFASVET